MDYAKQRFERLFKDSYPHMYRMAFSMVEDADDAKDAVHQVFTQMWKGKPEVGDSQVRGYLLAATRNQCLHILRQRDLRRQMAEELAEEIRTYPHVFSVLFDDTPAHYAHSSALLSISFDSVDGSPETAAAREEMREEVRRKPEAEHGNVVIDNDVAEFVHLLGGQELALVHDHNVISADICFRVLVVLQSACAQFPAYLGQKHALRFQPDPRFQNGLAACIVPRIQICLHEQSLLSLFLVIEPCHKRLRGLGRAHRTIVKI